MTIVKYTVGGEPTLEERAEMRAVIKAAKQLPSIYDPDCPVLTDEQLAEFQPVHFATREERSRAMGLAGIADPDVDLTEETREYVEAGIRDS